ncbi:carboxymuconolactone decarboxylase family protein [Segetibacter aerophilus]|uniref:Alkyl hydroperoxide reductase AhpD n=1 Tax=Segetibacter aerophilus TaxID=670293 RepID=A0A512B9S4_9BACT|nr:carboxymuconolactone decarboxylase family protein [Segetibacter aerophilus]GEO08701.1 alkyl hydroperoxide reductase AhpD [Segetibacter aerophilus]
MEKRVNIQQVQPQAYKAMYALVGYLATSTVSKTMMHLIKIRASQINGCAYCLDMHTTEALHDGETAQRIFLLNAWKESGLFTPEEQAILALTEEVTLISKRGVTNETYNRAAALFDEAYLSQVIMAIVTINAWNRIAITGKSELPK